MSLSKHNYCSSWSWIFVFLALIAFWANASLSSNQSIDQSINHWMTAHNDTRNDTRMSLCYLLHHAIKFEHLFCKVPSSWHLVSYTSCLACFAMLQQIHSIRSPIPRSVLQSLMLSCLNYGCHACWNYKQLTDRLQSKLKAVVHMTLCPMPMNSVFSTHYTI